MPLIVVPTPVGNLEDMTLRGIKALQEADIVACEDTRHTLRLLNHLGLNKQLISCHEHNETERVETLIKRIKSGETVALVSDAGTPGLSDPGSVIIKAVLERGLPIDVLPGANALLPALLLSGMEMDSFLFVGFLKGKTKDKRLKLSEVAEIKETLVFYVSPHKILKELALMGEVLGDRKATLVKEISKIHQETFKGTLHSFDKILPEEKIRGEFVCIVEGNTQEEVEDENSWKIEAETMLKRGDSTKDIANSVAMKYSIPRNRVKRHILEASGEEVN